MRPRHHVVHGRRPPPAVRATMLVTRQHTPPGPGRPSSERHPYVSAEPDHLRHRHVHRGRPDPQPGWACSTTALSCITSTTARRSDTVASGSKLAFSTSVSRIPSTSRTLIAALAKWLHSARAGIPRTTQFPCATREMGGCGSMKKRCSATGAEPARRRTRHTGKKSALRVPTPVKEPGANGSRTDAPERTDVRTGRLPWPRGHGGRGAHTPAPRRSATAVPAARHLVEAAVRVPLCAAEAPGRNAFPAGRRAGPRVSRRPAPRTRRSTGPARACGTVG